MSAGSRLSRARAAALLAVLAIVLVGLVGVGLVAVGHRLWPGGPHDAPPTETAASPDDRAALLARREGFGAGAGRGAATLAPRVVERLGDRGPGTLRAALAEPGGWVSFAPGLAGEIRLDEPLVVPDDTVIDGRGAAITLAATDGLRDAEDATLLIDDVTSVIVTNISLGDGYDGVLITGASRDVWIDRVTAGDVGDEVISVVADHQGRRPDRVTLSWLRVTGARRVLLIDGAAPAGGEPIRVTLHHSVFIGCLDRQPLARAARVHAYGNWLMGWGDPGTGRGMSVGREGELLSQRNVFDGRHARPAIAASDLGWPGAVRSEGDVVTGEATVEERDPGAVFATPADVALPEAGDDLRVTLERLAGRQPPSAG